MTIKLSLDKILYDPANLPEGWGQTETAGYTNFCNTHIEGTFGNLAIALMWKPIK